MQTTLLEEIGLTRPQAQAYKALIEHGASAAPVLAAHIGESRTNTYKILDRLCELGLAHKDTSGAKTAYIPASPATLEQLLQKQAGELHLRERKLKAELPNLLDYFFAHSEQPAIRFFQGKDGIQKIFGDMLATGKDIYLLRSPADVDFYDEQFFATFRKKRSMLGIRTYALTVDIPTAVHNPELDKANRFFRTWLPVEAYTGQVEWDIFGDKVALISYGQEAMGIIIESPQIAESFRQVFRLLNGLASQVPKLPADEGRTPAPRLP
jgi:HTH-type transcriptional regulator, sugar sensing transcriptional regulator